MVKIITDTTACLPPDFASQYQIPVIPQVINFGDESYLEGIDIDQSTFLQRLKSSPELPKTAAPPPELFIKTFQKIRPSEGPVLCIHPSAEISGTVRSATIAARDFPNLDIRVIDTRLVAGPLAIVVQQAALWAESGLAADTIQVMVEKLSARGRIYFLVSTLEYLAKGGRIGGASALMGSILNIKPILRLLDGKVESYEKSRTHKRALARLVEIVVEEITSSEDCHLLVMHADAYQNASQLASELQGRLDLPAVPIFDLPPAIVVHAGPGMIGVGFFLPD